MTYRWIVAAIAVTAATRGSAWDRHERGRDDEVENVSRYAVKPLVADVASLGPTVDSNLQNGWGIASTTTSFWWVSDNGTGMASLFDGNGAVQPLVVTVTGTGGAKAAPTGVVANEGSHFVISEGGVSKPAVFIFASEDGTISGWNAGVPPSPAPTPAPSTHTVVKIDESSSAVFKGVAISPDLDRLYAANFHAGKVEVFDGDWKPVATHGFSDPELPKGYAPFGIRVIGVHVFVTYALQDDQKHDDVPGQGHGFVDEYTLDGDLVRRVASRGKLNSPWGLALAPDGFGSASGHLLVGNFGDGHIVVLDYDADDDARQRGAFLRDASGPIVIDGLWGIGFGNGAHSAPANVLYFAAGPNHEADGLFGRIDLVRAP